eukprot:1161333-Pelagomonas_calceolata.AAC.10
MAASGYALKARMRMQLSSCTSEARKTSRRAWNWPSKCTGEGKALSMKELRDWDASGVSCTRRGCVLQQLWVCERRKGRHAPVLHRRMRMVTAPAGH